MIAQGIAQDLPTTTPAETEVPSAPTEVMGMPGYMAPDEIFHATNGMNCDVRTAGVLVDILLGRLSSGEPLTDYDKTMLEEVTYLVHEKVTALKKELAPLHTHAELALDEEWTRRRRRKPQRRGGCAPA